MKLYAFLAGALLVGALAVAAPAQAQPASSCRAPGKFVFNDVATKRADIPSRMHTTFAALGLKAKLNNCSIAIVCTPAATGEDRYKVAGQRCAAVRQAVARYERRPGQRTAIQDSVEKVAPKGQGYPAGSTVVILR